MALTEYELTDRTTLDRGTVFCTGVQALARLPVEQLRVDRANGLNTAAFASGYPGSPLAGYDIELRRSIDTAPDLPIVHRPAVNEELGVTAVMGSQLAASRADATYDGVVGLWYGKAPGLDRSSDALRHAVFAGTSPAGGAVAIVGDDPAAKSSTLPSSSDATFVDLHLPILYPADVGQALDLGRHAIALSRASGLWVGLKIVSSVADGTANVALDPHRVSPVMPTIDGAPYLCRPDGLLLGAHSLEIEQELRGVRSDLAVSYGALNELNRLTVPCDDAWLGIIASGVTHRELMEALRRLGLDEARLAANGIRIMEMQMPIPFHASEVREFARGLEEVMVVEEMNPTLARLVRDCLYNSGHQPHVTGKYDRAGRPQFPSHGPLTADRMLEPLRTALESRLGGVLNPPERRRAQIPVSINDARTPFFCSGCPHNQSTRTPEGTIVGAGIGCHTMAMLSDDPRLGEIVTISAMGGEGAPWIGMSPFVESGHLTQNLGDGTYFHSGQLAVQAAVDAGVNITYKVLLNGHVAMTGGQRPPGQLDAAALSGVLLAQGVARVIVTADDTARLAPLTFPGGVDLWDRSRIIEAQEVLASTPGVTVLVHDQPCAAELRRARRRGAEPTPDRRLMIHEGVCEGCGDCSEKSSCLSVQPVDTPLGPKTRIDQTGCNLDYACLDGDCPSFLTVRAAPRRWWHRFRAPEPAPTGPPVPQAPPTDIGAPPRAETVSARIRFAGIGGTGVVTVSQVIGTAAMLDGLDVHGLDQTGLSQKAGPVVSDLLISSRGAETATNHLGDGQADALIALDSIVAASNDALAAASPDRTALVGSTSETPTASMITHPDASRDESSVVRERIEAACIAGASWADAARCAETLVGEPATANMFVVGMAWQAGLLPVSLSSVLSAIDVNSVAVQANRHAFAWGRLAVSDPPALQRAINAATTASNAPPRPSPALEMKLADLTQLGAPRRTLDAVALRCAALVDYQSERLATRYIDLVLRAAEREQEVAPGRWELTDTVTEQLHRVLAYKDEYEVARLLTDAQVLRDAARLVDGPARVSWNLHPPTLRDRGLGHKIELGPWAMPALKLLARSRRLRGTWLDPFGRAEVRRAERGLAEEYAAALEKALAGLGPHTFESTLELAQLPRQVRGYEDRKLTALKAVRKQLGG
ncbi:MAG: indolepyruvate ferredoxin oxidoreductase family protein [Actinomycetia bacterium]|nr:indolepyruvate ferredoxin oxidoreductase family protein [Actinomycetes bacterium]